MANALTFIELTAQLEKDLPDLKTYKVWSVVEVLKGLLGAGVKPSEAGKRTCDVIDNDLVHEATTADERTKARCTVMGFLSYNMTLASLAPQEAQRLTRPF